jgi:hypothetical protein
MPRINFATDGAAGGIPGMGRAGEFSSHLPMFAWVPTFVGMTVLKNFCRHQLTHRGEPAHNRHPGAGGDKPTLISPADV